MSLSGDDYREWGRKGHASWSSFCKTRILPCWRSGSAGNVSRVSEELMSVVLVVEDRQAELPAQGEHTRGKAEEQRGDDHYVVAADVVL